MSTSQRLQVGELQAAVAAAEAHATDEARQRYCCEQSAAEAREQLAALQQRYDRKCRELYAAQFEHGGASGAFPHACAATHALVCFP